MTFGPVGRVVMTALVLPPLYYAATHPMWLFIGALYGVGFVPLALRDVWSAAPIPLADVDPLEIGAIPTAPTTADEGTATDIENRPPPPRW